MEMKPNCLTLKICLDHGNGKKLEVDFSKAKNIVEFAHCIPEQDKDHFIETFNICFYKKYDYTKFFKSIGGRFNILTGTWEFSPVDEDYYTSIPFDIEQYAIATSNLRDTVDLAMAVTID